MMSLPVWIAHYSCACDKDRRRGRQWRGERGLRYSMGARATLDGDDSTARDLRYGGMGNFG